MKTALIPARSGSKRIPHKNIKELAGHPLLSYSIQVAKDSGLFDAIMVSSDSEGYLEIAESYGARALPREIPYENGLDMAWIQQALPHLQGDEFWILRPTNPLRMVSMLKRANNIWTRGNYASMRAVREVSEHPNKMWTYRGRPLIDSQYLWEQPTSNFDPYFIQTGSLEIFRRENAEKGHISGDIDNICMFQCFGHEGLDINTPDDWVLVEALVEKGLAELPEIN